MPLLFTGCTLIDGTGREPISEAALCIEGDRVDWAGPLTDLPADKRSLAAQEIPGCTIIPGLIDAHTHVCLDGVSSMQETLQQDPHRLLLNGVATLRSILASGTTALRDLGGIEYLEMHLRWAIQAGRIPGPRMRTAGKMIAMTGGHCHFMAREADGPEEVRKAAREQIKAGADLVKLMASGGNSTPGQDMHASQLTAEEMSAAVAVAHSQGRSTAAHCHGAESIKNAMLAGVDTVEHGTYLDEEAADMMAARGRSLVLTLALDDVNLNDVAPHCRAEAERVLLNRRSREPHLRETIALAREKGILCGAGGDGGVTAVTHPFRMARELAKLVQYGFSELEAITIATRNNARILGWARELGTLEKGRYADFLILAGNPLEDIRHARNVLDVYLGGRNVVTPDLG